jgi:hypothetical protein
MANPAGSLSGAASKKSYSSPGVQMRNTNVGNTQAYGSSTDSCQSLAVKNKKMPRTPPMHNRA